MEIGIHLIDDVTCCRSGDVIDVDPAMSTTNSAMYSARYIVCCALGLVIYNLESHFIHHLLIFHSDMIRLCEYLVISFTRRVASSQQAK